MVLNRIQTVKIEWSKPILFDNRENSMKFGEQNGVYMVTVKYERHGYIWEYIIYIGETTDGFKERCNGHWNNGSEWLCKYGTFYIRFGKISIPKMIENIDNADAKKIAIKHLLLTIESTLLQSVKNTDDARLVNKRQIKTWSIYYDLYIHNSGNLFKLKEVLNTRDYYNYIITNHHGYNVGRYSSRGQFGNMRRQLR